MDVPPPIPPVIEKRFLNCSIRRLCVEIFIAGIAGMVAFILPVFFLSERPPNYEHVVFIPIIGEAGEMPQSFQEISFGLSLLIGLALGIFGRGPFWLIGPAVMSAFPVWSLIDGLAGGGGHDLWPFEMIFYVVTSLIYIIPAGIGRLAKRWWIRRFIKPSAG